MYIYIHTYIYIYVYIYIYIYIYLYMYNIYIYIYIGEERWSAIVGSCERCPRLAPVLLLLGTEILAYLSVL
jgi:hypothetical protein